MTQQAAFPKAIKDLALDQGQQTERRVVVCNTCLNSGDHEIEEIIHSCVTDGDTCYDPLQCKEVVNSRTTDHWRCNECGSENIEGYAYQALNKNIINARLSDLQETVTLPQQIATKRHAYGYDAALRRSTIPRCSDCGDSDIIWDSYIRVDHLTGHYHEPQCFEPQCLSCGTDPADVNFIACSAHEEVELTIKRAEMARDAQAEIQAIYDWVEQHGSYYGVSLGDLSKDLSGT
jgi:hypothetical protein